MILITFHQWRQAFPMQIKYTRFLSNLNIVKIQFNHVFGREIRNVNWFSPNHKIFSLVYNLKRQNSKLNIIKSKQKWNIYIGASWLEVETNTPSFGYDVQHPAAGSQEGSSSQTRGTAGNFTGNILAMNGYYQ